MNGSKQQHGVGSVLERVGEDFGLFTTETSNIRANLSDLAAKEMELLRAEVSEQAKIAGRMALFGAAGAVLAILTLAFLAVTLFVVLDSFMDAAYAAPLTSLALAGLAGTAALLGRREMQRLSFKPKRTIDSLKEDAKWLGSLIKSNKK